jgi:hypothetical protein
MRCFLIGWLVALAGTITALAPAQAQVYATSIVATHPDPEGKVPAFNVVPGAGIATWSNGLAQAVLTHGQYYNYCVSLGSAAAKGSANVSYRITRGKTVIQSATIITAKAFKVGPNGVWYYCSGYRVLPSSPGPATLTGIVGYIASGSTTPTNSIVNVGVLLR